MKKRKSKKKFNVKKFIRFILVILIISICIYFLINAKTRNIVILNNDYYNDEEIIETANIQSYPKFLLLNRSAIKKKLLKLDLVEDVKITKKLGFILQIDVKEKKILYYIRSNDEYKLSTNENIKLDNIIGMPTLINFVPEDIEKDFVKGLTKVDKSIINMVSEIEYSPSEFDTKRFLLYMNDGNLVYITITRIDLLNKYVDVIKKVGTKKGILYLDSGNYFEIKK